MKSTTVLLAVILLFGVSCITKDKTRTIAAANSVLPEIPVKEEHVEKPPPPPPGNSAERLTMKVGPDTGKADIGIVESEVRTIGCDLKGLSEDYDVIPPPIEKEDSIGIIEEDSNVFFMCNLEAEAKYPGGNTAWVRFLKKNVKYPADTSGKRIPGTVVVQFVIDEEGNVTDVKAVRGSEPLTSEAVRVIKKSSKWAPARLYRNDRPVKSYKTQPFVFRVE